jgi:hypothetical protein
VLLELAAPPDLLCFLPQAEDLPLAEALPELYALL